MRDTQLRRCAHQIARVCSVALIAIVAGCGNDPAATTTAALPSSTASEQAGVAGGGTASAPPTETPSERVWTGVEDGIVWTDCGHDDSGPVVYLAVIDPETGDVRDEVSAALPDGAEPGVECHSSPAIVARQNFNTDFTKMAVEVRDPSTRAISVGLVDVATGEYSSVSRDAESDFSAASDDSDPTFDLSGERLWYRSGPDNHLRSYDLATGTRDDVGEVANTADDFLVDSTSEWFMVATPEMVNGSLLDPSGEVVFMSYLGNGHILRPDGSSMAMFCSGTGDEDMWQCMSSNDRVGGKYPPNPQAAAWVDAQRLLAFDGTVDPGVNNVILLRFDDDYSSVTGTLALPPSDWNHESVVVSPDKNAFAVVSRRGEQRTLFAQNLRTGSQPTKLVDLPHGAIIAWR